MDTEPSAPRPPSTHAAEPSPGTPPGPPADPADPADPDPRAPGSAAVRLRRLELDPDRIRARVLQTKERLDASSVGHVQRRLGQADLANQAMILAALALSLMLPVLVTLAAVLPLGSADSLPAAVAGRLGLNADSVADLQKLFPTREAVRGASTVFGSLFTVVSAYAWPTALQRGYELVWGVPSKGWRGLWRPLVWLTGFLATGAVLLVLPNSALPDPWRTIVLLVIWTPVVFAWSWWTQHFLLRGAVGWRQLLPGAVATTIGLVGLRAFAAVKLSSAIHYNFLHYGPLGIVFMLLTWLTALSTVMLGGPVLGAAVYERRHPPAPEPEAAPTPGERGAELLAGLRNQAAARGVPAPRARADEDPADGSGRAEPPISGRPPA